MRKRVKSEDAQIEEFETKDLGKDMRAGGVDLKKLMVQPKGTLATSILLDTALIERLKKAGKKRGLGYQTMLKVIVHEHIGEY